MKRCAVYVHIPFCVKKCAYCDFVSYPGMAGKLGSLYTETVKADIAAFGAKEQRSVSSVFIGGGTPTVLPADQLAGIIDAVRHSMALEPDAEITAEANPGTVDEAYLRALCACGVNRVSFGAQSADDGLLRLLGRIHTRADAEDAVYAARSAGFTDISIDLMYALPGQTEAQWRETLEWACALPLTHISCYSLINEPGTPLTARIESGELTEPDEDTQLRLHRMTLPLLRAHGFERYEISNYARGGHISRHNMTYWQGGDYAGFGCAAHSLVDGVRYREPGDIHEYLSGIRRLDELRLTDTDMFEEALMLGTRTSGGISIAGIAERFGIDIMISCAGSIKRFIEAGAVTTEGGRLRLTERGFEVHSHIINALIDEAEGI